jgi:hypothetical protein
MLKILLSGEQDVHVQMMHIAGSVMFLSTMFLMGGPQPQQKEEKPQDMGHENAAFTLDRIADVNETANRHAVESSRL